MCCNFQKIDKITIKTYFGKIDKLFSYIFIFFFVNKLLRKGIFGVKVNILTLL